jgi:hypothetical protein
MLLSYMRSRIKQGGGVAFLGLILLGGKGKIDEETEERRRIKEG